MLRNSCNDFDGLQKNLAELMNSDYPEKKDLTDLVTMFEYLTPSYSLDFLTLVIIAAGLPNHQSQSGCKKAYELEIFKLLK